MGGIICEDLSLETQQFMPRGFQRSIVTIRMFKCMVRQYPHLIPDISREYIEDKSKSDWLGKVLTLWQVTYFCVLCVFRLSQRFLIPLLEVNVFAHAICAVLLFGIWWDKPRDIQEPVSIRSEEALDICAHFLSTRSTDMNRGD